MLSSIFEFPRGEAWEYNGRDACLPTDRAPGLGHEEILYRFLTVSCRFVACYADSATETAKLLLPNDDRVTFVENRNPGPRASASKARVTRVTLT